MLSYLGVVGGYYIKATKALVVNKLIAIFCAGYGKLLVSLGIPTRVGQNRSQLVFAS